jgi:membrane protease YdiL (CAAX protease family)
MKLSKPNKSVWSYILSVTSLGIVFFFVVSFVAVLVVSLLLGSVLDDTGLDAVLNLAVPVALIAGCGGLSYFLQKKKGFKWRETLSLKLPKKNVLWLTPAFGIAYIFILVVAISILAVISPESASQQQEVAQEVTKLVGWQIPVSIIGIGLMTPIAEEMFFRGMLTSLYVRRVSRIVAIVLAALLFSLAHAQLNVGIDTLIFGIFLGLLTWKTESIYPAIFLHMAKNCIALSVILK